MFARPFLQVGGRYVSDSDLYVCQALLSRPASFSVASVVAILFGWALLKFDNNIR